MTGEKYSHYFDINPEYFPVVNERVMNENPDLWKTYYPHETFVNLLWDTWKVLQRMEKKSIWVEGAYGTGKSHAVLTLKKLLDASREDTKEYFKKFRLENDLYNKLEAAKRDGIILTVHRYGSSSIRGDQNLIFAIQESIEEALGEKGIENKGRSAMKGAVLEWLKNPQNKNYFNEIITTDYYDIFNGDNADDVINKLEEYSGDALAETMDKVSIVAGERGIKAFSMDIPGLIEWIKDVIKANNLKAIVFIWDEFTEFFQNNSRGLTGFQNLAEISGTDPFYFVIVTHKSAGLFAETDNDSEKILDRFVKPRCELRLPENIAFQLMGSALEKKDDETIKAEWTDIIDDLYDRTRESREIVKNSMNIKDSEMRGILPLHPYAAELLKQISTAFESNQRSMFDFIKSDKGDKIKGFQWYIENYGPYDENPLLTIDMLWDFFYESGRESLSPEIRMILDTYRQAGNEKLSEDEKRVLKTALLLQAISQNAGDNIELFKTNEKNIKYAFEGSDLENRAVNIADRLVAKNILYKRNTGDGQVQYVALTNARDLKTIEEIKTRIRQEATTSKLIVDGELRDAFSFGGALYLRYKLEFVSDRNFDRTAKRLRGEKYKYENQIIAVVSFAKNEKEYASLESKIKNAVKDESLDFVFIDASSTPLGNAEFEKYVDYSANQQYFRQKDRGTSSQYGKNALDVLKAWRDRISNGSFRVYTSGRPDGYLAPNTNRLTEYLKTIDKERFPLCLEGEYNVTDVMYAKTAFKQGAKCGINETVQGRFNSGNQSTKLENALKGAWKYDGKYWEDRPNLLISKIKNRVEEVINEGFAEEGKISIKEIYDVLSRAPFGFLPCNLSAFVLGFLLKEYTKGAYSRSDLTTNVELKPDKMREMIDEIIKLQTTFNPRYKDKYIVAMTKEEKSFNSATSKAFGIPVEKCISVERTRSLIRNKMREYSFPIWTLKYILDGEKLKTEKNKVSGAIDLYCGIVNNRNYEGGKDSESNIAREIGSLCIDNKDLPEDLQGLLTKEKCTEGMKAYLNEFEGGELLRLAKEIEDGGQYINVLRGKFSAVEANWVWNEETANEKIREVILEYKITAESNKIISKTSDFTSTVKEWCEKCRNIKVSYESCKNLLGERGQFMGLLCSVYRIRSIPEAKKREFYDLLVKYGENFRSFYNGQRKIFKEACKFYLEDFTDEEADKIFSSLPKDLFTLDISSYANLVSNEAEEFRKNSAITKLKEFWLEKTDTASPKEWSEKYLMSIIFMVDPNEMPDAKDAFDTLNRRHPDESSVDRAKAYLEKAEKLGFFSRLSDEKERDLAFRNSVIKDYDVVLTDIDYVKHYLRDHIRSRPYDWYWSSNLDGLVTKMAEAQYLKEGCNVALEKIDDMEPENLKKYLKELIKDNIQVGIAIIKEN